MRIVRAGLGIGFAAALVLAFYVMYLRPPVTWAEWALLTVGLSLLGGIAIGRRWAVAVAFAANALLSLFLLAVAAAFGHVGDAAWLLVQVLAGTAATAGGVQVRRSLAGRFAVGARPSG